MFWNESSKKTVGEIKAELLTIPVKKYPEIAAVLEADDRKSVRDLSKKILRDYERFEKAAEKTKQMLSTEKSLREKGFELICGIDEVGRGPLAGPVVCAAVIMNADSALSGVDDSKKLTAAKREELSVQIKAEAIDWKIGLCSPQVIDEINILQATKTAMGDAVSRLKTKPDLLLIDAVTIPSAVPVKSVIHGDATCYSIAAASIIAKVYRDALMREYHEKYPEYDFIHNMGYGTAKHIEALKKYGPTPIHRKSFIQHLL